MSSGGKGEMGEMGETTGFQLSGTAPWRYEQYVAPIMAPFVGALLDTVRPAEGQSVLDVACGTGFVAREAARRVGDAGWVAGVDINPGMLEVARSAASVTHPTVDFRQAGADDLPFDDGVFDVVVCQQGFQFFPDPAAAVDETVRVTRPGGMVGITVWSPVDHQPYFVAQLRAIETILGPDRTSTFLDAFASSADAVAGHLRDRGLVDVMTREVLAEITLHDVETYVVGHLSALPWGMAIMEMDPALLDVAGAAILDLLDPHRGEDGTVVAPFASALVSGRRP